MCGVWCLALQKVFMLLKLCCLETWNKIKICRTLDGNTGRTTYMSLRNVSNSICDRFVSLWSNGQLVIFAENSLMTTSCNSVSWRRIAVGRCVEWLCASRTVSLCHHVTSNVSSSIIPAFYLPNSQVFLWKTLKRPFTGKRTRFRTHVKSQCETDNV